MARRSASAGEAGFPPVGRTLKPTTEPAEPPALVLAERSAGGSADVLVLGQGLLLRVAEQGCLPSVDPECAVDAPGHDQVGAGTAVGGGPADAIPVQDGAAPASDPYIIRAGTPGVGQQVGRGNRGGGPAAAIPVPHAAGVGS